MERRSWNAEFIFERLMSGHLYRTNFLHWNVKGSKKGKKGKKGKISGFFALFAFFASSPSSLRTTILKMCIDVSFERIIAFHFPFYICHCLPSAIPEQQMTNGI
jgi:hypothetical protein